MAKSERDSGIQSQYLLRSEFYLRRAIEYAKAWHPTRVPASQRKRLDWRDPSCFGISSEAWARVIAARLDPALVFCHPDLAAEHSECLGYYARAACISGKGLARLCSIADTEKPDTHRSKAPVILNRHVSTLIESERRFLAPAIRSRLQLMSYGAEVNGSWRNQVGRIGAEVVQKVLMEWLSQHEYSTPCWTTKDGSSAGLHANPLPRALWFCQTDSGSGSEVSPTSQSVTLTEFCR